MKLTKQHLRTLILQEAKNVAIDKKLVRMYSDKLASYLRGAWQYARTERFPNNIVNDISRDVGDENMLIPSRYEDIDALSNNIAKNVLNDNEIVKFVTILARQTLKEAMKPI